MFNWNIKEKPLFTGIHFGFGVGGGIPAVVGGTIIGSGGVVTAGIASVTDGYTYHTFVSPGTFTWTGGDANSSIEFLLVAGGGGGGDGRTGGGGGAGQVLQSINYPTPGTGPQSISITVGNGGAAISATPVDPGYGGDTIVSSPVGIVTAKGGGWGGIPQSGYETGGAGGGSQGGKRSNTSMPLTFPSPSFGYPLGNSYPYPTVGIDTTENYTNWSAPSTGGSGQVAGGGGGGSFGVGHAGGYNTGEAATYPTWIPAAPYGFPSHGWASPTTVTWAKMGAGGDGLRLYTYRAENALPPSHPYYPTMFQLGGYYGGGGGGGTCSPYPNFSLDLQPGGKGGGACGTNEGNTTPVPGMNGTGGGGGGGGGASGGSAGGKGICIIRYKTNVTQVTGGSVFTSGSRTYHIFTESGMFEVPDSSPYVGSSFDALLVGGGGGGGSYNAGGGGAGRRREYTSMTLASGKMAVVIGQGGRGGIDFYRNPNTQASPHERGPWGCGGQATFILNGTAIGMPADNIIAGGGSHGGSNSYDRDGGAAPGPNDGSGGGGCDQGTAGPGTQSNGGGASGSPAAGGGGGGHAANGADTAGSAGGAGGAGTGAPWIPSSLPALFGDPFGGIMYHAGGGGGGARPGSSNGGGGVGGGGDGTADKSAGYPGYAPMNGQYATGGGGGGGEGGTPVFGSPSEYSTYARGRGGDGGPGVMIISYPT